MVIGKNKANSNPIKAKTKPIQTQLVKRAKLMQSVYLQRIIKKNADRGYEKTNPIQSQFKPNTNPIQTQFKANQSQNKPKTNPIHWMLK